MMLIKSFEGQSIAMQKTVRQRNMLSFLSQQSIKFDLFPSIAGAVLSVHNVPLHCCQSDSASKKIPAPFGL